MSPATAELALNDTARDLAALADVGVLTPTSLQIGEELSFDTYEALGGALGRVGDAIKWWQGDWMIYGERLYGEEAYQAHEALGLSEDSRQRRIRASLNVGPERRRAALSWYHHFLVSPRWLDAERQDALLAEAEEKGWSTRDLSEQLTALRSDLDADISGRRLDSDGAVVLPSETQMNEAWTISREIANHASKNGHGGYTVPAEPIARLRALHGIE